MYKRAEELWGIYWKKTHSKFPISWDNLDHVMKRGWWEVALAESRLIDQVEKRYWDEEMRLKTVINTMVKRKHYNDAIKSLSVCQQQIETMALELTRIQPHNRVAADAFIVLGLLEAIITANPDMQTDEWKTDAKAKQDMRNTEFIEHLRWSRENVNGTVGKDYKP